MDKRRDPLPSEAKEFLIYCDAVVKKSTVSNYVTSLRKFYDFLKTKGIDENKFFDHVHRALFEEWFFDLFHAGLKSASRFAALMNMRCYLKWAADRGYLKEDPDGLIRTSDFPKRPRYIPKPLEPEHDRKLIEYFKAQDTICEMGLLVLRWGGMRVGEILSMPWDCLHQDEDDSHYIYVPPGKMYNDRNVPLTEDGAEVVKKIQKYPQETSYTWKNEVCPHCDHQKKLKVEIEKTQIKNLMTKKNGVVVSYSGMRSAMNKACERAGIPHYSVHQLRHTFATTLLNAGASLVTLQRLLGHKEIEMTLRYAEVTQATIKKEYFAAIRKTMQQYDMPQGQIHELPDPIEALADLIRLIEKKRQELQNPNEDTKTLNLLKRLRRIQIEVAQYA